MCYIYGGINDVDKTQMHALHHIDFLAPLVCCMKLALAQETNIGGQTNQYCNNVVNCGNELWVLRHDNPFIQGLKRNSYPASFLMVNISTLPQETWINVAETSCGWCGGYKFKENRGQLSAGQSVRK